MDRVAVFVDAGYLFAQGSSLLAGSKLARGEVVIDHAKVAEALTQFAERVCRLPLLRIYWYDGTSSGPTAQHIALAYLPGVKVRLGLVNSMGEQKGVDSLIVTDMITLAQNRAMAEAVLLSGDEDLRVGVQQAQELGVRVHLLGIKPSRGSQSVFLLQEADTTAEWSESDLSPFLSCNPRQPAAMFPGPQPGPSTDPLTEVVEGMANEVAEAELDGLVASIRATHQLPKQLDGRLLARSRTHLARDLTSAERREVRKGFLSACETRLAAIALAKVLPPE
ncbi:MAG TPA: NYN domain-containing protein [Longimicrobium sp.]